MKNKPESANALARLESAFAHRIAGGHWNASQADFWSDLVWRWPEDTTVEVCSKVISQFETLPSASEMLRLKREHDDRQAKPTGAPVAFDDLGVGPAPWYVKFHLSLIRRGMNWWDAVRSVQVEARKRGDTHAVNLTQSQLDWKAGQT